MKNRHIILTISVLTSRKEEQVRRCLESLEPLRREIPSELILVDTSEDPHMREVLEEYTDHIVPFHWIQDFSAARNAGLREAEGEWFLYLDDDEWFGDLEHLIQFFKSGAYKDYNGGMYLQRNYSNMEGTKWDDAWVFRFAKIIPGLHFTSPIHEYLKPIPDHSMALKTFVHHYGYVYETKEQQMEHYERNQSLIRAMVEREPDSVRWRLQMLQEYRSVGKAKEMSDFARECLEYYGRKDEPGLNIGLLSFYAAQFVVCHEKGDHDQAYQICRSAQRDPRLSRMGQAYFDDWRSEYEMARGDYAEAERAALRYLEARDYFEEDQEEKLKQGYPPFATETFEEVFLMRAYSVLICAGLKQKNPSYLSRFFQQLRLDKEPSYFYPPLLNCLVEAMVTLDEDKTFAGTLEMLHKNEKLWHKFEIELLDYALGAGEGVERLSQLVESAGADSSFLKLYSLRSKLCHPAKEYTGGRLEALLEEYAKLGTAYYEALYTDEERAYSDEREKISGEQGKVSGERGKISGKQGKISGKQGKISGEQGKISGEQGKISGEKKRSFRLPDDYRAALFLRDVFEEKDIRKKIPKLKAVVEAYPPFSEAVKRYVLYLGKQAAGGSSGTQTQAEMERMARQVMRNIPMMLDRGMVEEAYGVVKQLRGMIPGDEELKQLEVQILRLRQ